MHSPQMKSISVDGRGTWDEILRRMLAFSLIAVVRCIPRILRTQQFHPLGREGTPSFFASSTLACNGLLDLETARATLRQIGSPVEALWAPKTNPLSRGLRADTPCSRCSRPHRTGWTCAPRSARPHPR